MRYLDKISDPADLQQFSERELTLLADEVRETILSCVSETGGHLAPSLGTVELTVALHSVLHSPKDKIVWDVGHQCYAHKLLTGRRDRFGTIRQYGGLSGFPNRAESPHDIIGTGHASTSISYGLGLVEAERIAREDGGNVVCVLGDGALTGGVAFEALNQAGHLRTPLVVVLNDNEMSIRANVGALQLYLNRIRLDPTLTRLREDLEHGVAKIPAIGHKAYRLGKDVKESMKAFLVPGMLFEELGFAYIGVVDGHDMHALRQSIRQAIDTRRPVVVHVKTIKGKGYEPAEARPDAFHGTGPFHIGNGASKAAAVGTTYTQAFGEALVRLGERDERIVAITAAMTQGTGLEAFERRFPDRFYDVGIAEEHAAVFAAGLAIGGMRPVVALYSTFLQRAFDMLVQDIGLQHLPVVFAVDRAGLVGDDGPTHHGAFDLSFLRIVPGMTVMAPSSQEELQRLLATALTLDGPVAIRYPRGLAAPFSPLEQIEPVEVGRGVVLQEGGDVALVGVGTGVGIAREAALLLAAEGGHADGRGRPLRQAARHGVAAAAGRHPPAPGHRRREHPGRRLRQRRARDGRLVRRGRPLRPPGRLRPARRPRAPPRRRRAHAAGGGARRPRPEPGADARQVGAVRERLDALLVERGLFATRAQARAAVLAGEVTVAGRLVGQARHPDRRRSDPRGRRAPPLRLARRRQARPRPHAPPGGRDRRGRARPRQLHRRVRRPPAAGRRRPRDRRRRGLRAARLEAARGPACHGARAHQRSPAHPRTSPVRAFIRHRRPLVHLPDGGLDPVLESLRAGFRGLVLVKPQFEAGRERVGKGGVVRDPAVHADVLQRVAHWLEDKGAVVEGVCDSGHPGPKGNVEYFILFRDATTAEPPAPADELVRAAVDAVHG